MVEEIDDCCVSDSSMQPTIISPSQRETAGVVAQEETRGLTMNSDPLLHVLSSGSLTAVRRLPEPEAVSQKILLRGSYYVARGDCSETTTHECLLSILLELPLLRPLGTFFGLNAARYEPGHTALQLSYCSGNSDAYLHFVSISIHSFQSN